MNSSSDGDKQTDVTGEVMSVGKVPRPRIIGLAAVELSLFVLTCQFIVMAWARFEGPSTQFGLLIAFTLFAMNTVCGVYRRANYLLHTRRLIRSGIAHIFTVLLAYFFFLKYVEYANSIYYLVGMAALSYFISNTLRPVLVEIIRAGNEDEKRRQPAKLVS